jgi:hypothetical protein
MRRLASLGSGAILVAGLCASLIGCRGETPYPVRGVLVYDDDETPAKELAGFTVTFTSESAQKSAIGNIAADGSFKLTSLHDSDGAFPGKYKVVLTQPHPDPERGEIRQPVIDLAYEHPQKTKLEATVERKNNEFSFKLKRLPRE